jgi:protein-S-isoprenylcysteine O-methyltransferase Ste14
MIKLIGMLYGLVCYILGVASLVLIILFANNHMGVLGMESLTSLNISEPNGPPLGNPVLINIGLLLLFSIQHTVMARPGFKAVLTKVLPESWERSTYVLATAIVILALVQYWQPMNASIWSVQNETARIAINIVFYLGWVVTLLATYMINHFHLFGLQQSFKPGDPDSGSKEFRTPMFYQFVRHPIQTGVVIGMIAAPDMTTGRALLAVGMFIYIAVGLYYEERDLIAEFGDTYRDYKKRVPGVIPFLKRSSD